MAAEQEVDRAFADDMKSIYNRARTEAHYNATLYLRMLAEAGPRETARRLCLSSKPSDGFTALWERGRLDLTVEALVLQPQYRPLFSEEVLEAAEQRLADYGYPVTRSSLESPAESEAHVGERPTQEPMTSAIAAEQSADPGPQERPEVVAPAPPPTAPLSVPPGWYPDPYREAKYRWWDGSEWTSWTDLNWRPTPG